MIFNKIMESIKPGTTIPKPAAKSDFVIKGIGKRRGEQALIYYIPNSKTGLPTYEKGITISEFESAYLQLNKNGMITRTWFNTSLSACSAEGGCNFTTIGGIFELLGIANYDKTISGYSKK